MHVDDATISNVVFHLIPIMCFLGDFEAASVEMDILELCQGTDFIILPLQMLVSCVPGHRNAETTDLAGYMDQRCQLSSVVRPVGRAEIY